MAEFSHHRRQPPGEVPDRCTGTVARLLVSKGRGKWWEKGSLKWGRFCHSSELGQPKLQEEEPASGFSAAFRSPRWTQNVLIFGEKGLRNGQAVKCLGVGSSMTGALPFLPLNPQQPREKCPDSKLASIYLKRFLSDVCLHIWLKPSYQEWAKPHFGK